MYEPQMYGAKRRKADSKGYILYDSISFLEKKNYRGKELSEKVAKN